MPGKIEVHTVLHFKAPVNIKLEPRGPEHGGIFILQNTRSKIGQLLHKLGHFDSDMHTTVCRLGMLGRLNFIFSNAR